MFKGSKRLLYVGIVVGWLLAIAADQLVGYEYRLHHECCIPPRETQILVSDGWEYVQELQERDYYLRRQRWMGWVEDLRCNPRWCF